MSSVWKCHDCGAEHPDDYKYCPQTGISRLTASAASPEGLPRSWRSRAEHWWRFKDQLDDLDDDELRCAGLMRVTESKKR